MKIFQIIICSVLVSALYGQTPEQLELQKHLRILSSDEMMGRKTGDEGYMVAARYVAEELRFYGVQSANEDGSYYQPVTYKRSAPPRSGSLQLGDLSYVHGEDLLTTRGVTDTMEIDVVFAEYGLPENIEDNGIEVSGKFVLALQGGRGITDPGGVFGLSREKRDYLMEQGALGLIETYSLRVPWSFLKGFLNQENISLWSPSDTSGFYYSLLNVSLDDLRTDTTQVEWPGMITYDALPFQKINAPNVVGIIQGTDEELKDEYVVISAHLDHVGAGKSPSNPATATDSIFNGARDNAIGISSLLYAAKSLAANPPKRSVLLLAFSGEEIGLLGSEYYVDHPVIPLSQCIFNLNCDGAGYNDTTLISIFGLDRTGAKAEIEMAAGKVGLGVYGDPAPEQNLFDRSDNVNFARVGIPAPTFSPGFKEFDQEIMKNYHQPSDEYETLDMDYVFKFAQAFHHAARLIADKEERPVWSAGDKYEEAFKKLYGVE